MPLRTSLFLAVLLAVPSAFSQSTTAQVVGRVVDPSGAAVIDAELRISNSETGATRQTKTNESGSYSFPLLQPGSYRLSIQKEGFRPVTQTGIALQVDQVARIDVELELGAMTQAVEVTAAAPLLSQDTSALGQVVDSSKISNIPLNGRSTFRLVQLTPGVLAAPSANGQFGDMPVNTNQDTNFSINGGRNTSNEIQIDGVPSTTGYFNTITTIPSVEATQEFKVQSNSLSAEWGRFNGGVINVSTRSGSNDWHGALYDYVRNDIFDANEFFNNGAGRPKPPFRMNQFGGALGGRIVRNRTFFFTDYQGTRWRRGDVFRTSLPTAEQRRGDFSQTRTQSGQPVTIYDPLTTRPDPARPGQSIRDPFPGNVIPSNRLDPVAVKLMSFYPQPNTAGNPFTQFNNFVSNANRSIDQNQFSGRLDHNVSDGYRIFGRFARNRTALTQPDYYGNPATPNPGAVGTTPFTQTTVALDNTVTLSPSTILNVKYGYARWHQLRATRSYGFDQRELGMPDSLVRQFQIPVFPIVNVEQYGALGGQSYLLSGNDTHSLLSSVTKIVGNHNLKAGIDIRVRRINFFNVQGGGGTYAFNRAFTRGPDPLRFYEDAGNGIASLLLGYAASGNVPVNAGVSLQNIYYAGYVQDDFRIARNFTLNFGLRYETESPFTERRNQIVYFDSNVPSPARNAQFPNLTGGLAFANENDRYVWSWDKLNFAPRLGFAWSLPHQFVIRGGGGLYFSPAETSSNAVGFTSSTGFSSTTPFVGSTDGGLTPFNRLSNPYPDGLVPPTRDSLGASTFLGQGFSVWDSNPIMPETYQWNLDIQKELPGQILVDVAYAGSRGIHLAYRNRQFNELDPQYLSLGTQLNQLVPNPFFGTINVGTLAQRNVTRRQLLLPYPQFTNVTVINATHANSIYHSLQFKAEKRFSSGFGVLLSYTAGKLITDANNQVAPLGEVNSTSEAQNWYDLRQERSIAEMDISQIAAISFVAELPFGPGKPLFGGIRGVGAALIGGWQLNGITSARTGQPLVMRANIPGGGNRPNSTGRSAELDHESRGAAVAQWFDVSAFTQPPSFSLGNVSRTLPDVRGPGLLNQDLSLMKNTRIRERYTLQFRAEYFNIFNRPNFWMPNTLLGSGLTGRIQDTVALPRVGQLALKLTF